MTGDEGYRAVLLEDRSDPALDAEAVAVAIGMAEARLAYMLDLLTEQRDYLARLRARWESLAASLPRPAPQETTA